MVRPNHAGAVKFWCGYLQALLHGYVKASLQESFVVSYNLARTTILRPTTSSCTSVSICLVATQQIKFAQE